MISQVFKNNKLTILSIGEDKPQFSFATHHVKLIRKKDNESLLKFVVKNRVYFLRSTLIVFDEIYKFNLINILTIILCGNKAILTIHNMNKWLNRNIALNIRSILGKLILTLISTRVKAYIVISLSLKKYIIDHQLTKKKLYYIPFYNALGRSYQRQSNKNDVIVFTIPGSINTDRRNYKIFLKAFLTILESNLNAKIQLILLGKLNKIGAEENELLNRIKNISEDSIVTWNDYVGEDEFHSFMKKTDYLIGNINVEYKEHNIKEIYSETKETGVLFLMLKYGIPTLFPSQYKPHSYYEENIIYYEEDADSIVACMSRLINKPVIFKDDLTNIHKILIEKEILRLKKHMNI